jgi:hypothetical protein
VGVVFEYEVPLERGHRPDVVILTGGSLAALEFKSRRTVTVAALDQVLAYARDLDDYHQGSHGSDMAAVLVLPRAQPFDTVHGEVVATSGDGSSSLHETGSVVKIAR